MSNPLDDAGAWHEVARLKDIPQETGLAVRVGEHSIALLRHGERVFAVQDSCPHQGTPLAGGLVHQGTVICPLHAWQFRLVDGTNVDGGPGLCTFPVRVIKGRVSVRT